MRYDIYFRSGATIEADSEEQAEQIFRDALVMSYHKTNKDEVIGHINDNLDITEVAAV